MTDTVVLVPVLRRPHRVGPTLESLRAATSQPYRVLFICTPGDAEEIAVIDDAGAERIVIERPPGSGDYARKINAGYRATSEPFLFLGADDLAFHAGWLEAALEPMSNEAVGVVGTQDLGNPQVIAGRHATHSLVRRSYVDRFGTIDEPGAVLHEGYPHEWVDNELVETAKARGAWAFAERSVVEHLHPHWSKSEVDPIYAEIRDRMRRGRPIYEKRRRLWSR